MVFIPHRPFCLECSPTCPTLVVPKLWKSNYDVERQENIPSRKRHARTIGIFDLEML